MCSVDGSTASRTFMENILPWILPNMAILMACYTQAAEASLPLQGFSETLGIKANVLSYINKRLEEDFTVVAMETLPAVMHLALVEVSSPLLFHTFEFYLTRLLSGGGGIRIACGPT
jgi:hypothetical protein